MHTYPLPSLHMQSDSLRGTRVTVLSNATELFQNLGQSMPSYSQWISDGMGINSTTAMTVRSTETLNPLSLCILDK